ncbi:MAG: bifunctional riboflavin kinase/FAD synthetase [Leptolyngbya sp. SIO3F4]|nr:bifunctional riboflavin kinase/FAD synthetase [Leptolyngbya sp. SIO3F4]
MKVFNGIEAFERIPRPVVTTGTFDGVHIGHQKIIRSLRNVAESVGGESVVLTFDPHPRSVLQPESQIWLLTTLEEKKRLLAEHGIQNLIVHPFTKEFSRITSLEFVRDILVNRIGTHKLVIGYDHHFGRNREGSFEHLMEYGPTYGFEVEEISALDIDKVNVSSTKIRNALLLGDLETARAYLSYDYLLEGTVVPGRKLGRSLGFPTANLDVSHTRKLIPADGVYAVWVEVDHVRYRGMLNIGLNPTVTESGARTIEVNLFDFDRDIYGSQVSVIFKHRIRDEQRFDSVEDLQAQLHQDKETTLRMLD